MDGLIEDMFVMQIWASRVPSPEKQTKHASFMRPICDLLSVLPSGGGPGVQSLSRLESSPSVAFIVDCYFCSTVLYHTLYGIGFYFASKSSLSLSLSRVENRES